MVDDSEIPELGALGALIANFPCDVYGELEVLDGLSVVSKAFIDASEIPNRICLSLAVLELSKQRQRLVEALLGLCIIRLSPLNLPQLNQPLPLQNRQRPLFIFFLLLIRVRRGLGLPATRSAVIVRARLAQEGLGLGDGFGELAVLVGAELVGDGLGLL